MVDALAAVELAIFLRESGQTPLIDPTLQSHKLNLSSEGIINMTGHAWGQAGSIDRVEYRVDGGEWMETTYSATPSEIGALTPFEWHILLEPKELISGNHTVEVHAVTGAMHSLPVFFEIEGIGAVSESMSIPPIAIGIVIVVALAWVASLVLIRFRSDDDIETIINSVRNRDEIEEVVEAELLDSEN